MSGHDRMEQLTFKSFASTWILLSIIALLLCLAFALLMIDRSIEGYLVHALVVLALVGMLTLVAVRQYGKTLRTTSKQLR